MKPFIYIFLFSLFTVSCHSQTKTSERPVVGGPCEGCEAIYEYGERLLASVDTLPNFTTTEPKLRISGKVYHMDGKTPAANVILYIYQTNRAGLYATLGNETGWARRHGYIRGWIKTDKQGQYTFYTFRPGAYPGGTEPEHIHITVKEPDKNEYYIDDYVFDDDPLLTDKKRRAMSNRSGSGIVQPIEKEGIFVVERNIILGLNIPDY
ncbi:MAG: intradiol ring-cleavage dioxygenase [Bacteroidia bacterium]|nr:intradiol ring-cleavage dioxygenase [Bacteroidia bacterium]